MIAHSLVEGFKNLTRSFWLSATAISVLIVSLGSVAVIGVFSTGVGFTLRQLNNQLAIYAYFKRDTEQDTINTALAEINAIEDVKSVRFVNQEEARNELLNDESLNTDIGDTLTNNQAALVLSYVEIIPTDVENYDKIITEINNEKYNNLWQNVQGTQDFRQALEQFYLITNIVLIFLVIIFAVTSILVMINILRIAIYSHKDEIEIMRLVGATNAYIRGPFIAEGAYFNIIAAFVILATFIPTVNVALPIFEDYFRIDPESDTGGLLVQIYLSIILTTAIGVLSGVITAYLATQRYLKL